MVFISNCIRDILTQTCSQVVSYRIVTYCVGRKQNLVHTWDPDEGEDEEIRMSHKQRSTGFYGRQQRQQQY